MHSATLTPVNLKPLDLRRVYIFPTRHGWMLGALLIIILLGAINYDNALAYLLCFLLVGIFLVAMLHTYRNLAGLVLIGARAEPVFAGGDATFTVQVAGIPAYRRWRIEFARMGASRRAWRAPIVGGGTLATCSDEAVVTITMPAPERGRLRLGRLRLRSTFPLGILRAWAYFDTDAEGIVYPTPRGHSALPFRPISGSGDSGRDVGTDDFAGLARYRPGDSLRAIHWPTVAKHDEVLTKRFTGGGAGEVLLTLDATNDVDLEARLSQLTQWVLDAERQGFRYGLQLPMATFPIARGAIHSALLLRALALHTP
jgi:uncharacterized protein (DUF58 family)